MVFYWDGNGGEHGMIEVRFTFYSLLFCYLPKKTRIFLFKSDNLSFFATRVFFCQSKLCWIQLEIHPINILFFTLYFL